MISCFETFIITVLVSRMGFPWFITVPIVLVLGFISMMIKSLAESEKSEPGHPS